MADDEEPDYEERGRIFAKKVREFFTENLKRELENDDFILIDFVVVTEWAGTDGQLVRLTSGNPESPDWRHKALMQDAIDGIFLRYLVKYLKGNK